MLWKNSGLLLRSLTLYSGFRQWKQWQALFGQSRMISERACFYWLLYAAFLSDRWCHYEPSCRRHRQPAWVELRQASLREGVVAFRIGTRYQLGKSIELVKISLHRKHLTTLCTLVFPLIFKNLLWHWCVWQCPWQTGSARHLQLSLQLYNQVMNF